LAGIIKTRSLAHFITNRKYNMQTIYRLTCLGLLLSLSTLTAREPSIPANDSPENAVHVTIIYDNYQDDESLPTDWGFACLVEYQGDKLLFDAGRDAALYEKNVGLLGINPKEIPGLFISHAHGDHTAGMPWIVKMNPTMKCYLPSSYVMELKAREQLPENSSGIAEPEHLYGPYYSTGDGFDAFREQGLVIKTEKGGILITGCGHPGAVAMVSRAEEELGIEIHTLIGGLHLMRSSDKDLKQLSVSLKKLGVNTICPTHCTGDHSIAYLRDSFGEGYIKGGTGKEIIIH
jgi:7,8-dihydropterin-6-yl-methyl-4-(beta-D-ribofuranosyl)aminobenzene 5'-phosphate synthase